MPCQVCHCMHMPEHTCTHAYLHSMQGCARNKVCSTGSHTNLLSYATQSTLIKKERMQWPKINMSIRLGLRCIAYTSAYTSADCCTRYIWLPASEGNTQHH
jgi:hypothetical protein